MISLGANMVVKVSRPPTADNSGIYRRPQMVLRPTRGDEIAPILGKTKVYPGPVRPVGANYSQTRCVGNDGGTALEMSGLSRILELDEGCVRVQAGVRVGALVRALAERGLELPLTPEIGNISVGALAVTTLPQPSYAAGLSQLSSCVTELKVITPQGREMTVTERQRDLMRVLRSSFGLLGIVHEVVLRVRPLIPVKIDYQALSLADFTDRLDEITGAPGALRLHLSPFHDRVTVERRTLDEEASISRSGIWQISAIR
jgi:FAD/FMN-containing dehydrogenase